MTVIRNHALRRILSVIIPFVLIPALVVSGAFIFKDKSYSYVILSLVLLTFLLFISGFDNKRTGTRRLVLTAAFVALASIGRVICSPIAGVNPITAITVLAAIYMGAEAGFMIGSLSALVSGLFSGIGMWTPFQMFSWGIIGLFAGLLANFLKDSRLKICIYCFVSGFVFSFIMDLWSVFWAYNSFNLEAYKAALITAIPYTVTYAVSNCIFAFLFTKPFSEKLGRIKIKYGI